MCWRRSRVTRTKSSAAGVSSSSNAVPATSIIKVSVSSAPLLPNEWVSAC
eukprot:gene31826-39313_t